MRQDSWRPPGRLLLGGPGRRPWHGYAVITSPRTPRAGSAGQLAGGL